MEIKDIVFQLQQEVKTRGIPYLKDARVVQDNVMITCPYHGNGIEKNPSCGVLIHDTTKHKAGTVHCFTCGKTTDLEHMVSFVLGGSENKSFGQRWLLETFGIIKSQDEFYLSAFTEKTSPVFEYKDYIGYHDYFKKRGVDEKIAQAFELGYDPFYNSVVIPVFDKQHKCKMLIRRNIGSKVYKNSAGSDKVSTLYGLHMIYEKLDHLVDYPYVFITEGPFDVLRFWQFGYPAVGILQASISQNHVDLIKKLPFLRVVIATDNDVAGRNVAHKLAKALEKHKEIFLLEFPSYAKDVGELTDEDMESLQLRPWHTK